jgi:hypothetical protein
MYIEIDGHSRLDLSGRIDWATLCTRGFVEAHHMTALWIILNWTCNCLITYKTCVHQCCTVNFLHNVCQ